MTERQELHCHECGNYVQFDIDLELNGNHVLTCPVCGHEHCRIVKDGLITDIRWDSRNKDNNYVVTGTITFSLTSTYNGYVASTSSTTSSNTSTYNYSYSNLWSSANTTISTNNFSYQQWMNVSPIC